MIIFGTRGVTTTKDSGAFHCPGCASVEAYAHKRVRRFFTLYFIPIIPLDALGEYVECGACKGTYRPEVLDYDPAQHSREVEAEYHNVMRQVMVRMMLADGRIDDAEVGTICSIYEQLTGEVLPAEAVRREAAAAAGSSAAIASQLASFSGVLNDHGKEMVVRAAFFVAAADGDLAKEELALVLQVGTALGMSQHHVRAVVQAIMQPTPGGAKVA